MKISQFLKAFLQLALVGLYAYLSVNNNSVLNEIQSSSILGATLNFIVFLLIADFCLELFRYFYGKSVGLKPGEKDSLIFGVENLGKLAIGLAVIITIFGAFGIDLKSLLTSLSIVAAAIAIISKEFVNDFLIGLYLSFSKDFRIGDYVKIGDNKGKIVEIGMQKVRFQNDDDDVVLISHSKIYTNDIINYTRRDIRLASIDFQLGINTIGNIEDFEAELIESLSGFEEYIEKDSYNLRVISIQKDSIDFKFQYKIKKIDYMMQRNIRRKTVREVFNHISRITSPDSD